VHLRHDRAEAPVERRGEERIHRRVGIIGCVDEEAASHKKILGPQQMLDRLRAPTALGGAVRTRPGAAMQRCRGTRGRSQITRCDGSLPNGTSDSFRLTPETHAAEMPRPLRIYCRCLPRVTFPACGVSRRDPHRASREHDL